MIATAREHCQGKEAEETPNQRGKMEKLRAGPRAAGAPRQFPGSQRHSFGRHPKHKCGPKIGSVFSPPSNGDNCLKLWHEGESELVITSVCFTVAFLELFFVSFGFLFLQMKKAMLVRLLANQGLTSLTC